MTLRHMKIFVTVCECQSVTQAAEKLYLAQPSVSLAIRELEQYYGVRLFDRISRRLYLTDAGKKCLEYASHIVSLSGEMEREVKDRETMGSLRIGSSITIGTCLMPGYVKQFRDRCPGVAVKVIMDNSSQIVRQVNENLLDFALIEGAPEKSQLVYRRFLEDYLVLVCPKDSPLCQKKSIRPEELAGCDFLLREKGSGARELFDSSMLVHNIVVEPKWESISTQALLNAVSMGLGVSVLPQRLAQPAISGGLVASVPVEGVDFRRCYYIVFHRNKYLTDSMKAFLELCGETTEYTAE